MLRLLFAFSMLLFLLCTERVAVAGFDSTNAYEMHGVITWRGLSNGVPSGADRATEFIVTTKGCLYRIDQTNRADGWRHSIYFDGTNYYTESLPRAGAVATNEVRITQEGFVTKPLKKPVPINQSLSVGLTLEPLLRSAPFLFPVWLPFGGGCHFATETASEIPSIFLQGNGRSGPLLQFEAVQADRVFSTNGNLSRYTDYWNETSTRHRRLSESALTNIDFQVLASANEGGLEFPARFRFVRYFYSPGAKPEYYMSMDALGETYSVRQLEIPPCFTPAVTTNATVVHFRSYEWDPVTYVAANGRLKTQKEVDEQAR